MLWWQLSRLSSLCQTSLVIPLRVRKVLMRQCHSRWTNPNPVAWWSSADLGRDSCQPISGILRWQSCHQRWYSGRYGGDQKKKTRTIGLHQFLSHVCWSLLLWKILACSARQRWTCFLTWVAEVRQIWRCQTNSIFIPTHFLSRISASIPCFCTTIWLSTHRVSCRFRDTLV